MGEVYEAEHVFIHKRLALKLLRTDANVTDEAAERLYREANATSTIGHRNIVRIEDFGHAADGAVYLAMEWLDGILLEELMKRGPVPLPLVLDLMAQTCAGLAAAHAAGVVHRDMKPANILLLDDGDGGYTVKLVDFGIAKLMHGEGGNTLTRKGTFVGTPHYVSPEQALGETVDHRADLYAVGVMLYELSSGALPFDTDAFIDVLQHHVSTAPEPPSARSDRTLPPALDALILRCLEKDPAKRFASAAELEQALQHVLIAPAADDDALAGSSLRLDVPASNPRWPYLVAIVVLLGAGVAVYRWQHRSGGATASPAPDDAQVTQVSRADAAPAVDAGLPPPSRTQWQYRGHGKHFAFRASMTPIPVSAGEQLTLEIDVLRPDRALAAELAKGGATVTVELVGAARLKAFATSQRRLLADGKLSSPIHAKLPKDGRYHVVLRIVRARRWLARAQFDICIGASPAGDPQLFRRVCPP